MARLSKTARKKAKKAQWTKKEPAFRDFYGLLSGINLRKLRLAVALASRVGIEVKLETVEKEVLKKQVKKVSIISDEAKIFFALAHYYHSLMTDADLRYEALEISFSKALREYKRGELWRYVDIWDVVIFLHNCFWDLVEEENDWCRNEKSYVYEVFTNEDNEWIVVAFKN
jgi:hypothetical protein